jgi:ATP-binding cassette, subfamily C, bacterial
VILDEATCHLDPAAEAQAELAFTRRPGALLVIAHRTSSALRARKILVLDGGQAHLGSHQELLTRSPLYQNLVGHWQSTDRPGSLLNRTTVPAAPITGDILKNLDTHS